MRRAFRVFLMAVMLYLLAVIYSEAAPFLVCDPYPSTGWQPTKFLITIDGGAVIESPAFKNPDNSVQLKYDLGSISAGSHSLTVRSADVWGSSTAVPFSFTKPSAPPTAPANINISGQ